MSKAPGLEHLIGVQNLTVKQKKELFELIPGVELNNRYEILNEDGKIIYYAYEETNTLKRVLMGSARPFNINIVLPNGEKIMALKSSTGFFTREVDVEIPIGTVAFHVKQEFAMLRPSFYVRDLDKRLLFKINSPLKAAVGSFKDVDFDILANDETTVVGRVTKKWGGMAKEIFTDADTFVLTFNNLDMDVKLKAAIIAALFLVDFEFYQTTASSAVPNSH